MWWLLACTQPEPSVTQSLDLFSQGKAHLEAGRPAQAEESFAQASAVDPQSAELWIWQAKALAEQGKLPGAIEALDRAVALRPGLVEGWYNRACYKARAGDLEGAKQDLQQALRSPELDRILVARDPDLAPLRKDPANAGWIPLPKLEVRASAPTEPAFLGAEIELSVTLGDGGQQGWQVRGGPESPLLQPVQWLEETSAESPGQRRLRLRYKVQGGGEAQLGPWTVRAGGLESTVETGPLTLLAPKSHQAPVAPWPGSVASPSELLADQVGARRLEGSWVVVSMQPGDRVVWDARQEVVLELRQDGVLQALGVLAQLPQGSPVSLYRGQAELWTGTP